MNKPWQVYLAAATGLTAPDVFTWVRFVENLNPVLDAFVRIGQVGVAVATVFYIYRKAKNIPKRRSRKQK